MGYIECIMLISSTTSVIVFGGLVVFGVLTIVIALVKHFVLPRNEEERERLFGEIHPSDFNGSVG